jgi:hypothetical protein
MERLKACIFVDAKVTKFVHQKIVVLLKQTQKGLMKNGVGISSGLTLVNSPTRINDGRN